MVWGSSYVGRAADVEWRGGDSNLKWMGRAFFREEAKDKLRGDPITKETKEPTWKGIRIDRRPVCPSILEGSNRLNFNQ